MDDNTKNLANTIPVLTAVPDAAQPPTEPRDPNKVATMDDVPRDENGLIIRDGEEKPKPKRKRKPKAEKLDPKDTVQPFMVMESYFGPTATHKALQYIQEKFSMPTIDVVQFRECFCTTTVPVKNRPYNVVAMQDGDSIYLVVVYRGAKRKKPAIILECDDMPAMLAKFDQAVKELDAHHLLLRGAK